MSDIPTDAEFRAVGYTPAAAGYPLSDAAFKWLCEVWNGCTTDQAPRAWRYAPSRSARDAIEQYAASSSIKRDGGQ